VHLDSGLRTRSARYSAGSEQGIEERVQMVRGWETAVDALIIVIAAFVLLNAAALIFGADSRDGNDWSEHPRP
jgi:hypothetical protein